MPDTECHGCGLPACTVEVPPEPPDGTRIELEHCTDVYAAWRCDRESDRAGWTVGDGGETWVLYGHTVPQSWLSLACQFGPCVLALAVRLIPVEEDLTKRRRWPTQTRDVTGAA